MSKLLKRLRHILRRYKGLITIGTILIFLLFAAFSVGYDHISTLWNNMKMQEDHEEAVDVIQQTPFSIHLQTEYMCGIQTEIKSFLHPEEMEEWLLQNKDYWDAVEQQDGGFILKKRVTDDLSPLCKAEGYFGINKDHVLTIFEGPPAKNKVIQTFFRIDTQLLESKLPADELLSLKQGIRIHNVDEYLSVLSTYGEFATEY